MLFLCRTSPPRPNVFLLTGSAFLNCVSSRLDTLFSGPKARASENSSPDLFMISPLPSFSSQPHCAPSFLPFFVTALLQALASLPCFSFAMSEKLPILPISSSPQKPLSSRRSISSPLRATSLLALGGLAALTLTSLATSTRFICHRTPHSGKEDSLGSWIERQSKVSWWSMLENM